jgi:hypothetical protein
MVRIRSVNLQVRDPRRAAGRLIALGARRAARQYADGADPVVLLDPEGNQFRVTVEKRE